MSVSQAQSTPGISNGQEVFYNKDVTSTTNKRYGVTPAETAAGVTPTNEFYDEGYAQRYGTVTLGSGASLTLGQRQANYSALITALTVAHSASMTNAGSGVVTLPGGVVSFTPTGLAAGTQVGSTSQNTSTGLWATGTQAFVAGTAITVAGSCPSNYNTNGLIYYVIAAGLTSTSLELSTSYGGSVLIPSSSGSLCALTVQTGLVLPNSVTIRGSTAQYAASVLQPYSCGAFIIDGNGPNGSGGYINEIWQHDFLIDTEYANATSAVYLNNTDQIYWRDGQIVSGFGAAPTITHLIGIFGYALSDNFYNVRTYGNSGTLSAITNGWFLNTTGSSKITIVDPDSEYVAHGFNNASANTALDIYSPYCEQVGTDCYVHNTGGWYATIYGGIFKGAVAYEVNLESAGLTMVNTLMEGAGTGNFTGSSAVTLLGYAPTTITAGPLVGGYACNATMAGNSFVVTNGVSSPSYFGTVGTTGSATNFVGCNGSNWVYH